MINNCISKKRCYRTEEEAIEALIQNHIVANHRTGSGPINVYQCNDCQNWHLTSKGERHACLSDPETLDFISREKRVIEWERRFR